MQALILCGGLGTRLQGIVSDRPKSMALIRETPFLEILLKRLCDQGIGDIILATGYKSDFIQKHFGDGSKFGLKIQYSHENQPLGTGGAIKLAEGLLNPYFFIFNGDTCVDFLAHKMISKMEEEKTCLTFLIKEMPQASRYGTVTLGTSDQVLNFQARGQLQSGYINAGVYYADKNILKNIPTEKTISWENDVIPNLLPQKVFAIKTTGLFIDIGIPEDYQNAQTLLCPSI